MPRRKRNLLCSVGNLKVGPDTIIMNITSATDCPSRRRGLCQVPSGACYALRDERRYKKKDLEGRTTGPLRYRRMQTKVWDALSAEEIAEQIKDVVKRRRKIPIKFLRMQEAGDFRDARDVDKTGPGSWLTTTSRWSTRTSSSPAPNAEASRAAGATVACSARPKARE